MLKKTQIINHFKTSDPIIFQYLSTFNFEEKINSRPEETYYTHLVENIIGQQLSTKVADIIIKRFQNLFEHGSFTPQQIITIETETLRGIGMSYAKIKYVKDLSERTKDNLIQYSDFKNMVDEDVILQLTQVKGIGRWTAEMFLMFSLGRENVFSYGDGGLRRAMTNLYGLEKKADFEEIGAIVETWSPYKSYASLALWHSLDNVSRLD